ncbi:MAG: hypothetical protein ABI210_13180 [Abditibacteriaceae bacterium]
MENGLSALSRLNFDYGGFTMRSVKHMFSIFFIVLLFVIVGFAVRFYLLNQPRHATTVAKVTALIEKQVPIGASISQVMVFLESQHIDHDREIGRDGLLYAVITDTSWRLLGKTNIHITFAFEKGRLVRFSLKEMSSEL